MDKHSELRRVPPLHSPDLVRVGGIGIGSRSPRAAVAAADVVCAAYAFSVLAAASDTTDAPVLSSMLRRENVGDSITYSFLRGELVQCDSVEPRTRNGLNLAG
jgi:hypothetical protein